MRRPIARVCVYCASSDRPHPEYRAAAGELGRALALAGVEIVYGGGAVGSMGALADGALAVGGRVTGILPRFLERLELGHRGLGRLEIVSTMHERKAAMLLEADGVVALPGGSGTYEELLEAITWKRLGLLATPIVLLDTRGFFRPLLAALEQSAREGFMEPGQGTLWSVVQRPADVLGALRSAPSAADPAARG